MTASTLWRLNHLSWWVLATIYHLGLSLRLILAGQDKMPPKTQGQSNSSRSSFSDYHLSSKFASDTSHTPKHSYQPYLCTLVQCAALSETKWWEHSCWLNGTSQFHRHPHCTSRSLLHRVHLLSNLRVAYASKVTCFWGRQATQHPCPKSDHETEFCAWMTTPLAKYWCSSNSSPNRTCP